MMRGLYVITDQQSIADQTVVEKVDAAIMGGANIVQYRDKISAPAVREQNAAALLSLCRERGALLIINDDVQLAQWVNADGVHLGRDDETLADARERLGPAKIIGVSCYGDINAAIAAEKQGANYVAFGRFFASTTKPEAKPVELEILKQARSKLKLPIVAIGGITDQNGAPLVQVGADMLAVVDGVFGQPDVTAAARNLSALFL